MFIQAGKRNCGAALAVGGIDIRTFSQAAFQRVAVTLFRRKRNSVISALSDIF